MSKSEFPDDLGDIINGSKKEFPKLMNKDVSKRIRRPLRNDVDNKRKKKRKQDFDMRLRKAKKI